MIGLGVAQAVGGALRAAGTLYSAWEESGSLKHQARVKEGEALAVREEGIWTQIRFNEDTRRTLSTQRQMYGQAGVRMEGAPTDLMVRTKTERVMDRMQLAKNTAREVSSLRAEAKELRHAAKAAKVSGVIGAFSSFF